MDKYALYNDDLFICAWEWYLDRLEAIFLALSDWRWVSINTPSRGYFCQRVPSHERISTGDEAYVYIYNDATWGRNSLMRLHLVRTYTDDRAAELGEFAWEALKCRIRVDHLATLRGKDDGPTFITLNLSLRERGEYDVELFIGKEE